MNFSEPQLFHFILLICGFIYSFVERRMHDSTTLRRILSSWILVRYLSAREVVALIAFAFEIVAATVWIIHSLRAQPEKGGAISNHNDKVWPSPTMAVDLIDEAKWR